jgi:transposase
MPKEHELTDIQKGEIVTLEPHFSHADIGTQLHIQRPTVTKFLQRFKTRKSIENLPRPGRPRKTSKTRDRWIIRNAESETRVPLKALKNILNLNITEQTIRRRLREAGIRKWRAVNRSLLTKQHAHERRKWAKEHLHWTVDDWRRVFFTDESMVERDSDPSVMWVFRRQTKMEKYAPKNIRPKRRQDGISVMVWGCFIGDQLGPIVFIERSICWHAQGIFPSVS